VTVDVVTETAINRPVGEVSAYATDPTNAPAWYRNIESIEWKTPPPVQVGSAVTFVARFLGRTLEYTYEFVELVPGERLVMRTRQGPFPMETTYTWSPVSSDSTRMTLRNRGDPAGSPSWSRRSWHPRSAGRTARTWPVSNRSSKRPDPVSRWRRRGRPQEFGEPCLELVPELWRVRRSGRSGRDRRSRRRCRAAWPSVRSTPAQPVACGVRAAGDGGRGCRPVRCC
jgi:hypothetical protein